MCRDRLLELVPHEFRGVGGAFAAVNGDRALCADEDAAAMRAVGEFHHRAAGIAVEQLGHGAQLVAAGARLRRGVGRRRERPALGPDLDRAAFVHAQRALDLVKPVRAPAGHLAAGVGAEREPAGLAARNVEVGVERHRLGRAAPEVPVELGRDRHRRQAAIPRAGIVEGDDLADLADEALADELAADVVFDLRPLLAAALEHAAVFAHRLHHQPALADRQRHRLLGIDILAGLARVDARQRTPVLRRRGDDRVNILPLEHLPVVLVDLRLVVRRLLARADEIDVGDGDDARVLGFARRAEQPAALPARADHGDADALVGAAGRRGQDERTGGERRAAGEAAADEGPARDKSAAHACCSMVTRSPRRPSAKRVADANIAADRMMRAAAGGIVRALCRLCGTSDEAVAPPGAEAPRYFRGVPAGTRREQRPQLQREPLLM